LFGLLLLVISALAGQAQPTTKINVNYEAGVPQAAQDAFNYVKGLYETSFYNPVTVNIDVRFTPGGLGGSDTSWVDISYANWKTDMNATSALFPGNSYLAAAKGTLPNTDPIGNGTVEVRSADAKAIGVTAGQIIASHNNSINAAYDAVLTFNSASNFFSFTGLATSNRYDFMSTAAHELNEALGIGSNLTPLTNNAALPSQFEAFDFFRYNSSGNRFITTDPNAAVYFTYDPTLAVYPDRFNQDHNAGGNASADRNDWIWGNFGTSATIEVQNAIGYQNQAAPLINANPTTSEYMALATLGWSVPEPSSFALMTLSLVFLFRRIQRRAR
jgi:hypothetical protein